MGAVAAVGVRWAAAAAADVAVESSQDRVEVVPACLYEGRR